MYDKETLLSPRRGSLIWIARENESLTPNDFREQGSDDPWPLSSSNLAVSNDSVDHCGDETTTTMPVLKPYPLVTDLTVCLAKLMARNYSWCEP